MMQFVHIIFWLMLGLMILSVFALLFVALRPGRVSARQQKRWSAEGEAGAAEIEDRRRRDEESRARNIAQWQEQRDKAQATEDPDPEIGPR